MNGYERIMSALSRKPLDRVPVMLHDFSLASRETGYTMEQFRNELSRLRELTDLDVSSARMS